MVTNPAESPEHEVASMASMSRIWFSSAIVVALLASCASNTDNDRATLGAAERQAKPIFLKEKGVPLPAIGRATEGRLSVNDDGCVYVAGAENFLIIWPPDAVYDEQNQTFRTTRSGVLQFGMNLSLTGMPVQPLKVSKVGGIEIPASCRRMFTILVAPDGVRKL